MILSGDTPIFIHRKTSTGSLDDYGNTVYSTETILVRSCMIAYGSTSEPVELNRNPVDAKLTIYMPHGTVVLDGDLFEIKETMWEKDGDPLEWETVQNFEVGVVVNVRRRRG